MEKQPVLQTIEEAVERVRQLRRRRRRLRVIFWLVAVLVAAECVLMMRHGGLL